ncbi:bifunctional adenosylcobinamide kinase/adenosylcobinamide-phosphate guanylyltransferase [Lysobacter antibioticus]|uniref:bifunctional adenosylcobinamide kinase/adenosylcobinamide-phosphate guanylyltransferase n=1 Tax=Lysobacter antibioticus TaxID=84531 RepID=UPI000349474B|nr:bifunctional adenosylcobinamide kinase/adenosylcobinamide-phosphate guanylyltransferase [Lysobacter antibioticus]
MHSLILGGARSGKSALAERIAGDYADVVYIATGQAGDAEMAARIDHHRARRPAHWGCIEEPIALAAALRAQAAPQRCVLVDCLTLWLSNLLFGADPAAFERERAALLEALPGLPGRVLLVSNEVGLGVVPMGEVSRRYVDEAGRLHQALGALCGQVWFVAAGLPWVLKGAPPALGEARVIEGVAE